MSDVKKCPNCGVAQNYHPPSGLECVENQLAQAREDMRDESVRAANAEAELRTRKKDLLAAQGEFRAKIGANRQLEILLAQAREVIAAQDEQLLVIGAERDAREVRISELKTAVEESAAAATRQYERAVSAEEAYLKQGFALDTEKARAEKAEADRNRLMLELDDLQCSVASALGWDCGGVAFHRLIRGYVMAHEMERAEAKRLLAIVDRLPKTADGVPIVPGMTVFVPHPRPSNLITEREVVAPYGTLACLTKEPAHCGCCESTTHRQARECYSTREAAEEEKP